MSTSRIRAVALVSLLAALAVWSRALLNGFVHLDDPAYVTENPITRAGLTWDGVVAVLTSPQAWNWHPFAMLSHMLDVELFGFGAAGHHLTSVLLHLLAAALLFGAVREGTGGRAGVALFVAAAFAMHPLRVQSVAWIAERKDVLCGAFWMAALWAHVRVARTNSPRARMVRFLCGVSAMLSKPMAMTLPATLLIVDLWPLARLDLTNDLRAIVRRLLLLLKEQAPLLAAALVVVVMTFLAQGEGVTTELRPLPLRAAAGATALMRYLWLTVWPADISISHGLFLEQPSALTGVACGALALAITVGVVVARRRAPWLLAGWLWYVVTLIPVLHIVQVGNQAVADRYTYVPCIGPFLAIAMSLAQLVASRAERERRALAGAAVVVVGLWSWRTWVEIEAWHDPLSLYEHAVDVDADDAEARISLALMYGELGHFDEATAHIERALQVREHPPWRDLLGQAFLMKGDAARALPHFQRALADDPRLTRAHVHLAEAQERSGKLDDAERTYRALLEMEPQNTRARAALTELQRRRAQPPTAPQEQPTAPQP